LSQLLTKSLDRLFVALHLNPDMTFFIAHPTGKLQARGKLEDKRSKTDSLNPPSQHEFKTLRHQHALLLQKFQKALLP
jgi:hypothetical protein